MPDSPRVPGDALAVALAGLLDAAHRIAPHQLPSLIRSSAVQLGASAAEIWLADHQLRVLVALEPSKPEEPLSVDATAAGRAFISRTAVEVPYEGGGHHLWLPLLDGVDRVGVLEIRAPAFSDESREAFRQLASVTAAELVTRGQYTDLFTCTRRQQHMSLAAELQWQSLPPNSFTTADVSVAAVLEPAYDIGGDTYDYAHEADSLHFAVLDAVGHDLESSIVSYLALGAYRNSRRSGGEFVDAARAMDQAIRSQLGDGRFVTGNLARLDTTTGRLRWLNAGHPPPLLIRAGRVIDALECPPRLPFGLGHLQPDQTPSIGEVQLEPGDGVVVYSDGVVEARRAGGVDFGIDRLGEFLHTAFAAGLSPAETVRRLSHAVLDFHGGRLQDDATTMLVVWQPDRGPRAG
jgi:serine phosphatase RsbU (regulator of sigma subunit)